MKITIACVCLLAALGCAQGEPIPEGTIDTSYLELTPTDARITPSVVSWTARWSAATGLDIRVGENGVPVGFSDGAMAHPDDPSVDDCGQTEMRDGAADWVIIDGSDRADCTWSESVGHEIGHAIEGTPDHSTSGIMSAAASTGQQKIDTSTLEVVCTTAPCVWVRPEE